jgi:hypothetical protein
LNSAVIAARSDGTRKPGSGFYLGLDNNHGPLIDLVTVVMHEMAHGLGFMTVTDGGTGFQFGSPFYPALWDHFLLDTRTNKTWDAMTTEERVASAANQRRLVWNGAAVTTATPAVLRPGTPLLSVTAPASIAGTYQIGQAAFGAAIDNPGLTGEMIQLIDTPTATGLGCSPLSPVSSASVNGKIALVDRGACTFTVKAENLQAAGAIGVIIADNVPGGPPADLGGTDSTITIPVVRITLDDAQTLKTVLQFESRSHSGVYGTIGLNPSIRAGGDAFGRAILYTPKPYQLGSSVNHWDSIAFPNQLMEPNINPDLTHEVTPPFDLTYALLSDLGWLLPD